MRLSLRAFSILFLVLSALVTAATFLPLSLAIARPPADLRAIADSLRGTVTPPEAAVTIVHEAIKQGGFLRRAIPVAYYVGGEVVYQSGASHRTTTRVITYLAWFDKAPKAILLIIRRDEEDGTLRDYRIGVGDLRTLIIRFGSPLLMLAIATYSFRRWGRTPPRAPRSRSAMHRDVSSHKTAETDR